jgi:hypothetical protein
VKTGGGVSTLAFPAQRAGMVGSVWCIVNGRCHREIPGGRKVHKIKCQR